MTGKIGGQKPGHLRLMPSAFADSFNGKELQKNGCDEQGSHPDDLIQDLAVFSDPSSFAAGLLFLL